ncbi:MAG: hypothetical protein HQM16_02415 [Deltaproteobacteria bacterium]|nr:hypothetical protein [Deltaproteobacteria bacterium]
MQSPIKILFHDDHYIAVHKSANLLVHRSQISSDRIFLLNTLRDQINQRIYPVHRLDRPTSGVIIFGLNPSATQRLSQLFKDGLVKKTYLAVVRGCVHGTQRIDYPLKEGAQTNLKTAITDLQSLATLELPIANSRHTTSRYTFLRLFPKTGRYHQLRKHLAHISHPVIGDVRHGSGEHNQIFRTHLNVNRLLLFAESLQFTHPYTDQDVTIRMDPDADFVKVCELFGGL